MFILDRIIADRGSKYAVSGSRCGDIDEAKALIAGLKAQNKKFAKATHHSWGLITASGPLKDDDGESGAGNVILKILEREALSNHLVVVTRWYGGKHLGGDRFRHVRDAVMIYLEDMSRRNP